MDEAVRLRLLRLTAEADERQRRDPAYATELATWARERERDGVPAGNVPEGDPTRTPTRWSRSGSRPGRSWTRGRIPPPARRASS